ncbi:MAG: galactofuranose ABC transporter, permease protein YjfF [Chloroflexota bacterium]|nr:galactofuranose ABC transporter, permease protein YjfF [Chloroflexota bacterium]
MEKLQVNRKFLPLIIAMSLFVLVYAFGMIQYKGFSSPQVFLNILIDNAFLFITCIGMTFVILSEGIDLSVGAVIALTTVVSAYMVEKMAIHPFIAIPSVLLMGTLMGLVMGSIIYFFKVQPFIVTLAGLFFARGMCFVISTEAITISHPFYRAVSLYRIYLPGGYFISVSVVIFLVVLVVALYLAHLSNFGRAVYAIGGNEHSARLMGLPVGRTKILVYTQNGFLSALAGVVFSLYTLSGYGWYVNGLELDAIAGVVIGGTLLTGGVGYVIGSVFGVLIMGLIQTIVIFQGTLNSWWTRIVVGLLTLFFILIQGALVSGKRKRLSVARIEESWEEQEDELGADPTKNLVADS